MHTSGKNTHAAFRRSAVLARWYLGALAAGLGLVIQAHAVSGNVDPYYIEIDLGANGANLYLDGTTPFIDWVKDTLPNTDPPTLIDGVAVGITNGTGMVGGTGHWNGVRVVDGVASADLDIFLTGGKENDTSSWNVGPGSVGSSKYDITQAYLANNKEYLYFGMERRGNNGTTAFDFEFNQLEPLSDYVPNRSIGDVLFTFEMSGSGNSGSATPYYFIWNGSRYVAASSKPASLLSSINQVPTPAAPWGRVDSHGDWVGTALERFEFAEASVLLAEAFTNFVPCGTTLYVQVRTRSSATDTSDLKDTTKIFEYKFGGPNAVISPFGVDCLAHFTYDGRESKDSSGVTNSPSLTYSWWFQPPEGVTLSGLGLTGPDADGKYYSSLSHGTVDVAIPNAEAATIAAGLTVIESPNCTDTAPGLHSVTVYPVLTSAITQKAANGTNMTVKLTGSAPTATALQWQINTGSGWSNISSATNSTLTYSSFETDATGVVKTFQVTVDGLTTQKYNGTIWTLSLRLHAERSVNGTLCAADSDPVTLRKVTGVDP